MSNETKITLFILRTSVNYHFYTYRNITDYYNRPHNLLLIQFTVTNYGITNKSATRTLTGQYGIQIYHTKLFNNLYVDIHHVFNKKIITCQLLSYICESINYIHQKQ